MNLTKLPLKMKGLASSGSLATGSDLEYFSSRYFAFLIAPYFVWEMEKQKPI